MRDHLFTIQERILLHLLYETPPSGDIMPASVTQLGISSKIGVRQSDISLAMKKLREKGYISENSAKIQGARKRQKVFSLTEAGKSEAEKIASRAGEIKAKVKTNKGVEESTVVEISSRLGIPISEVISKLDGEFIDVQTEVEKKEDLGLPKLRKGFYGRGEELRGIKSAIMGNKFVVIEGIAGIGKTTLVKHALEEIDRPLFEFRCREHTTTRILIRKLAEHLSSLGRTKTKRYLERTVVEEPAELSEVIESDLLGTGLVIFIDDAHNTPEILPFLKILMEILERGRCFSAIVSSRNALPFYDRRDVLVTGLVYELALTGIDDNSALKMLSDAGIKDTKMVELTKGHPLFLELICSHGSSHTDSISEFINEEVCSKLSPDEKGMVTLLSALDGESTLDVISETEDSIDILDSLVRKNIVKRNGINYEIHDCLRPFFYNRLTDEQKRNVHIKLARRFEKRDIFECLHHLTSGGAISDACAFIKKEQDRFLSKVEDFSPILMKLIYLARKNDPSQLKILEQLHEKVIESFGKWDDLLEYIHQCKRASKFLGKPLDEDVVRGSRSKKECETAIENYKNSIRVLEKTKDRIGLEELRLGLARTYWMLNKPFDALKEANEISDTPRKHSFIASVGLSISEPINAMLEAKRAYETASEERERVRYLCLLGYIYEEAGDLESAKAKYMEAALKARTERYIRGLAYSLLNEGSSENIKAARNLFDKIGDDVGLAYCEFTEGARDHSCAHIQKALAYISGKGLIAYERLLRQLISSWSGSDGKDTNDK